MSEPRDKVKPVFRNFVRMEAAIFLELIIRVGLRITRKDT